MGSLSPWLKLCSLADFFVCGLVCQRVSVQALCVVSVVIGSMVEVAAFEKGRG